MHPFYVKIAERLSLRSERAAQDCATFVLLRGGLQKARQHARDRNRILDACLLAWRVAEEPLAWGLLPVETGGR